MSSNKFLQRFEGKIQVVGKEGVQNVFGGKNQGVVVYTNNNFNQQNKNKTTSSLNKNKPHQDPPKESKNSQQKISNIEKPVKKQTGKIPLPPQVKQKKTYDNPFLISNPFYLDQQDKERIEKEKRQRQLAQKLQKIEREKEKESQRLIEFDSKKTTSNNLNKSLDKKKTQKEWIKLGGLGANIGGQDWLEKKKKLEKIQEFSEQVKSINKDKPKVPKSQKREEKKELNHRQKAIQYSKNVPKPIIRVIPSELQQQPQSHVVEEKLSELQLYELKHEQYKNMVRNQL